jgi:hypothetical protein
MSSSPPFIREGSAAVAPHHADGWNIPGANRSFEK